MKDGYSSTSAIEYPAVGPDVRRRYAAMVLLVSASHAISSHRLMTPAYTMVDTIAVGASRKHKAAVRRGWSTRTGIPDGSRRSLDRRDVRPESVILGDRSCVADTDSRNLSITHTPITH